MAIQSDNLTQAPQDQNFSIENRNFLSPIGFKFSVSKLRGVDFFCQSASIPAMQLAAADSYTRFHKIPNPGDEIQYEDLFIKFFRKHDHRKVCFKNTAPSMQHSGLFWS